MRTYTLRTVLGREGGREGRMKGEKKRTGKRKVKGEYKLSYSRIFGQLRTANSLQITVRLTCC